jgi:hypothetical protein
MLRSEQVEELICLVSAMDRETLTRQFQLYRANFPLDFTPEFLSQLPLDRMRHIFLAICLQSKQMPEDHVPTTSHLATTHAA